MKSSIITALILMLSLGLNAQIELEHSYANSATLTEIDEGEFKYYAMDVPNNKCLIFSEDHLPYKTIGLSIPSGYYLNDIQYLSRRIFNSDDYLELLYIYYKSELINSEYVYTYGLKVVSEQGNVLLNLANGGFAEIKEFNGKPKLFTYQYIWNDTYYLVNTNVYSLGASSTKSTVAKASKGLRIAPNPIDEMIKVEFGNYSESSDGKIIITDISGRQMLNQPFLQGDAGLNLNSNNFPPGTYILNMVTEKGIVASEKIVKN